MAAESSCLRPCDAKRPSWSSTVGFYRGSKHLVFMCPRGGVEQGCFTSELLPLQCTLYTLGKLLLLLPTFRPGIKLGIIKSKCGIRGE